MDSETPRPFQQKTSSFLHVLWNAGNCCCFEAEAIRRKAMISSAEFPKPRWTLWVNTGKWDTQMKALNAFALSLQVLVKLSFVTMDWKQESHVFKKSDSHSRSFLITNHSFLCSPLITLTRQWSSLPRAACVWGLSTTSFQSSPCTEIHLGTLESPQDTIRLVKELQLKSWCKS